VTLDKMCMNWRRGIAVVIGLGLCVGLVLWIRRIAIGTTPTIARVVVKDVAAGDAAASGDDQSFVSRVPGEHVSGMVIVNVLDDRGSPVEGTATGDFGRLVVRGAVHIPEGAGRVAIEARGFLSEVVTVDRDVVDVVMRRAVSISIYFYDVVTNAPVGGVKARVCTDKDARVGERLAETDSTGRIVVDGLPPTRVSVYGEALGYIAACESPSSAAPGLLVDLAGDRSVEVPMYPIVVGVCEVRNETNLSDDVLGAMMTCGFSRQPGASLPGWCDREVSASIARICRSRGLDLVYAQACYLPRALPSLMGQASFYGGARDLGRADVEFRPFAEVVQQPSPSLHVVNETWRVGELVVESPVALRICEPGALFGGLPTTPGSCTYQLPYGEYVVGPLDDNPLLDAAAWTRRVRVPEDARVVIAPEAGFATLELRRGDSWRNGVLRYVGAGVTFGVPLDSLPFSMPVTPGAYDFDVFVASGADVKVVWRGSVTLAAGELQVLQPFRD
jgi:hypothetical protein